MNLMNDSRMKEETTQIYRSLEDIRDRKDSLRDNIRGDEQQMRTLWNQLFAPRQPLSALSPSKRISSVLTTGAGILDGAILGWKLYRKFKKKR